MTEAGRRLLDLLLLANEGPLADSPEVDWLDGIKLIEAEAIAIGARQAIEPIANWLRTNLDVWDDDGTVAATIVRDICTKALNVVERGSPLAEPAP